MAPTIEITGTVELPKNTGVSIVRVFTNAARRAKVDDFDVKVTRRGEADNGNLVFHVNFYMFGMFSDKNLRDAIKIISDHFANTPRTLKVRGWI